MPQPPLFRVSKPAVLARAKLAEGASVRVVGAHVVAVESGLISLFDARLNPVASGELPVKKLCWSRASVHPSRPWAAVARDEGLWVGDLSDGATLLQTDERFSVCAFDADGRSLWCARFDGPRGEPGAGVLVRLVRLADGAAVAEHRLDDPWKGRGYCAFFEGAAPAGASIVQVGSGSGEVHTYVMRLRDGALDAQRLHGDPIRSLSVAPGARSCVASVFPARYDGPRGHWFELPSVSITGEASQPWPDPEDDNAGSEVVALTNARCLWLTGTGALYVVDRGSNGVCELVVEGHEPGPCSSVHPNLGDNDRLYTNIEHIDRTHDGALLVACRDKEILVLSLDGA